MKKLFFFILSAYLIGQKAQAQQCVCNPMGWQAFSGTISKNLTMAANCGHQFVVLKGQPFKLIGKYLCKGDCIAKYIGVLKNIVTDSVVQNYPVFKFPWTYTFTIAGNYKLEITPTCGDNKCQPCKFYYTVK